MTFVGAPSELRSAFLWVNEFERRRACYWRWSPRRTHISEIVTKGVIEKNRGTVTEARRVKVRFIIVSVGISTEGVYILRKFTFNLLFCQSFRATLEYNDTLLTLATAKRQYNLVVDELLNVPIYWSRDRLPFMFSIFLHRYYSRRESWSTSEHDGIIWGDGRHNV